MKISPHNHCESYFTGSTIASMVNYAKKMGRTHFACTDLGHLSSILKVYGLCQSDKKSKEEFLKRKLQFIPGLEFYFKDSTCPIIAGTVADRCKYFTSTVHCQDQASYQALAKLVSKTDFATIELYESPLQLWSWKDLEEIAKHNVTFTLGGIHCMVGKTVLAGKPELAERVFLKLKDIFNDRLYISFICEIFNKNFGQIVEIKFEDGTKTSCLNTDLVTTDRARRIKAIDLIGNDRHLVIKSIYRNGTYSDLNKTIKSSKLHKGFLPLPGGDAMLTVNKFLLEMSKKHSVPALVSDYAYYAHKDDKIVQTMVLEGNNKLQPNFHMKNEAEISEYLNKTLGLNADNITALFAENDKWAKRFDGLTLKYDWRLADPGEDPLKKAMQIIRENGRMKWDDPVWVDRLKEELKVIAKNGKKDLTAYFLPIRDVLNFYKENGQLTGPGRGSAGGSLFCYLLGITQICPFSYDLPFSRFFSMERINMNKLPDIDTDLESRTLLVGDDKKSGYLYGRWGNKAAQISTRATIRLKSAIIDTNRYLKGEVEPEIKVFSKGLPQPPQGISDHDFVFGFEDEDENHIDGLIETSNDLKRYAESRPKEWDVVTKAMGITKAFSRHACAFTLSDVPISDVIPTKEGHITQYEAKQCEEAGLIKYDFLVINQLKDIRVCMELINKRAGVKLTVGNFMHKGKELYIWDLPQELEVYKSIWGGATETLFQISTKSMTPAVLEILPTEMMHIANILALIRPGPIDCIDPDTGRNMVEEYYLRRKGLVEPNIKELADILPETYGIMCIKKGSKIKTNKGLVNIESVEKDTYVQTEDGSYQKVIANYYKGTRKTIRIRLDNSEELFLTPDHKVLTASGWKEARELTRKDLVKHFWVSDLKIEEGTDKDWLLGLLLADGSIPMGATPYICAGDKKQIAIKIKKIADKEWGLKCKIYFNTRAWYVRLTKSSKSAGIKGSNPFTNYIKSLELLGKTCYNKFFPDIVTKKMIEGFIEGDGCLGNRTIRIKNESMARSLFETLQALRIKSNLFNRKGVWFIGFSPEKFTYKLKSYIPSKKEKGLFYPKPNWKLPRADEDRQIFCPRQMLERPFLSEMVIDKISTKYNLSFSKEQTWSRVLSISDSDFAEVYDLSIEKNHSFVVGGNVVHNCFQEQLGKVSRALAGFSGEEAEKLRENMAKKKKVELMKMKPMFIDGASKKVSKEIAEKIWDQMETFGRYGFSIIHAVEYSMITYACMFLKHHYLLEWWAAILTNAEEKEITGKLWPYVRDFVRPPDINLSSDTMVVDYTNNSIRAKLGVVRGMGEATIEPIINGRPYKDIQDFVNKEVANDSMAQKLIFVGVLDSLFPSGMTLKDKLQAYANAVEKNIFDKKVEKAKQEGKKLRSKLKEGTVPEKFLNLHPLQDAALKKSILPSIYISTFDLGKRYSKLKADFVEVPKVIAPNGHKTMLINGESLNRLDEVPGDSIEKDLYVASTCYIIEATEFSYAKNTKRALKIIMDSDGFIHEKVKWPDYDSGLLTYPPELKKGCIATVFMRKRAGRKDMNIQSVFVET